MRRKAAFAGTLFLALALQGCGGGGGGDAAPGAPTVTISATPAAVQTGNPATLDWSSTNTASCVASGSWSGPQGTNGTARTGSLASTSTFTLICTGVDSSTSAQGSTTVTVSSGTPPPTLTFNATPGTVLSGSGSTLSWSSTNATSCTATGAWTGTRSTTGSVSTGPLTASATYTLTCSGAGGPITRSAGVTVTQPTGSYSTNFDLTENPISEQGRWRRANNGFTNVRTSGGHAYGTNGSANSYDDSYALLSGFGPDQTAEAVIYRSANLQTGITHEVELLLRFTDDGQNARGYECLFAYDGSVAQMRWDGGVGDFTALNSQGDYGYGRPLQTGDVVKATVTGSTLRMYINGRLMLTTVDTMYATGQPGISFFTRPGGNSANFAMDSYTVTSN